MISTGDNRHLIEVIAYFPHQKCADSTGDYGVSIEVTAYFHGDSTTIRLHVPHPVLLQRHSRLSHRLFNRH